ncbi:MAG: TonB-dependent receptor [Rhodothermales bacterium]|nr:TonB-dependent receptor [Rhodothermales bacterium]MBO6781119.1 TonB-dependent receptor [Rhodothermales bacterium]
MRLRYALCPALLGLFVLVGTADGQGVTTAAMNGLVLDTQGEPLPGANVLAVHQPSGTTYGTVVRTGGQYNLPNMRVGGPYTITVSFVGFQDAVEEDVFLSLAQNLQLNFALSEQVVQGAEVVVTAEVDDVLNSDRNGAATTISIEQVELMPTIKRSTRDLTRLDPRSDGNLSFGGRNWLYNNISLDGSYYNNPFGLDAPEPGGQSNAQPVPYDAIEQVQVSVAPFDVREGGFTGAGINQVTKSGTNTLAGSVYTFTRNEDFVGNEVSGTQVFNNPDLSFLQSGFSIGGPIRKNKIFFFFNAEIERREDPGTNFRAGGATGGVGTSRVSPDVMDRIKQRMISAYGYEPGVYQDYTHNTDNEKVIAKIDWNLNDNNNLSLRYNYMDASREQGPHPFVLSFAGTGRGPNDTSLPFSKSGYRINNNLHSLALELNSRSTGWANRFFASYNRFRDHREPFSEDFPLLEIGEGGATYTTLGHEGFSVHNILDQDVIQLTNNFSLFRDKHVFTIGANYESFSFFNSFNIFRHGLFGLPFAPTTFFSLDQFFAATDPNNPDQMDLRGFIGGGPFKGENIDVAQLSAYAQDEWLVNDQLSLTYGLRVDIPMYGTDPVANPYSTGLNLLDENDDAETIDQAELAGASPLFSPRVGFNYDVTGDRTTQLRGGVGIFTGRVPFVWIGNVISNPGFNPNIDPANNPVVTRDGASEDKTNVDGGQEANSVLQQSFDLNAMVSDFRWPQVFTVNLAADHDFGDGLLGTVEVLFSKDLNSIYVRNADLKAPDRTLRDGRPFFGGFGFNELNQAFPFEGAGAYVIDNRSEGYNFNVTGQIRKRFENGLNASAAYTFLEAKNLFKSTEIASVLFSESPVQGDPNQPQLAHSEFGNRQRLIASATYSESFTDNSRTSFGVFVERAQGNSFLGAGGNRYSFTYSGDVNGDGFGGNDLIYIPNDATDANEIRFDASTTYSAAVQALQFEQFIEQDEYLSENRGQIAERFGLLNPWFTNVDVRVMHELNFGALDRNHRVQISLDILNVMNLLNSDWGVRQVADPRATSPLVLTRFGDDGEPVFNFTGVTETFRDDVSLFSRWQAQLGLRYLF